MKLWKEKPLIISSIHNFKRKYEFVSMSFDLKCSCFSSTLFNLSYYTSINYHHTSRELVDKILLILYRIRFNWSRYMYKLVCSDEYDYKNYLSCVDGR